MLWELSGYGMLTEMQAVGDWHVRFQRATGTLSALSVVFGIKNLRLLIHWG